ncbi:MULTISPECIES: DUF4232 domain-containing protein [Saccharopolyspora]|uniref:DUF4232 domain-containing protein n=1 Tax=Saccharopolyspora gregorii TaxID=33914 RepID=A0ABP6S1D2_9PSEU|nr:MULTISPECIES: DUF4232 domain-containing protein [Saccharopolyspora]MCA1189157.1 DUF4232 domain-containing protein [Saccharopolyspora sp. 6T]MCA1191174.1 DUF4232 domain-containing protein [Saccharopolyspora sp. 6V]MCA1225696.1 DUF4232 domain-containing protein [Saccharopolyspora sp. 6M]MCA1283110.1 DUF4232 domain-containing protein [Saccharopolyspora sp. 7B]
MFSQRLDARKPGRTNRASLRIGPLAAAALGTVLLGACGSPTGQVASTADAPASTIPQPTPSEAQPAPAETSDADPSTAAQSRSDASGQAAAEPRDQVERCHTSQLSGAVGHGDSGAGQRYAELTLTNTSGEACTLYGYGGMQLLGADGQQLPTQLERTPNPGPQVVRLAPGESASSTLHWTAVPHEGESEQGPCQPEPARALVTPPDEEDPLTVRWDLGSVCGFGSIDNSAYHA